MAPHELLQAWADFAPKDGANVLRGDEALLQRPDLFVLHPSWESLIGEPEFGTAGADTRTKLHLSLIPQPFFGDLSRASVFVLGLNPGLRPVDYFAEFFRPEYRAALTDMLHQKLGGKEFPFLWFDPQFSWHSGYTYWHGRFASVIETFKDEAGVCRREALAFVAKSVAVMELMPYHSASFGIPGRVLDKLRSVRLARAYVSEVLLPRARADNALLVVTRQGKRWGLPVHENVTVYEGAETRAAHLGPNSRGGKAILERLQRRWAMERTKAARARSADASR